MFDTYDIVVVGGGHAGCEAAAAAANMGSRVLLITMNMATIGQMSCNPAMGGVAKGQIVREIDALGGYSGIVTDKTMIQFRMLNRSKGPAMWSPRAQNDRMAFAAVWRQTLEQTPGIDFWQDTVVGLMHKDKKITGVRTALGVTVKARAVILTNGTFLNGVIHIGEKNYGGGRAGERAATGITAQLMEMGFEAGRMKTGTPPRIDGRSIDYTRMQEQPGDEPPGRFSFTQTPLPAQQKSCWLTHTNNAVHEELKKGFSRSPLFKGRITGIGPRYCPSIEDKIDRFAERERHQLFVEPEGNQTVEMYLNGFSSSLPEDVQYNALKKIEGFENIKLFRPGYAIEYDYFPPRQLKRSLETQLFDNLYFAGQINGTTGYEEAACQGLIAGVNAHRKLRDEEPLVLTRSQAYIGVLIDDLVSRDIDEPYRMFTSRAEFRILLRQDNADLRLTEIGYDIGLAKSDRKKEVVKKKKQIAELTSELKKRRVTPDTANGYLVKKGYAPMREPLPLNRMLHRPEITLETLSRIDPSAAPLLAAFSETVQAQVSIQEKYAVYIEREKKWVEKIEGLEDFKIKPDFNYDRVKALSAEAREKLKKIRPESIGQMTRISGVSPADVSILSVYLGR